MTLGNKTITTGIQFKWAKQGSTPVLKDNVAKVI